MKTTTLLDRPTRLDRELERCQVEDNAKVALEHAMQTFLSERERKVVTLFATSNVHAVASKLEMTVAEVRRVLKAALPKLNTPYTKLANDDMQDAAAEPGPAERIKALGVVL